MKKLLLMALLLPVGSAFGMQDNRQVGRFDKGIEERYYATACVLGGIYGGITNKQNPLLGVVAGTLVSGVSFYTTLYLARKSEAGLARLRGNGAAAK